MPSECPPARTRSCRPGGGSTAGASQSPGGSTAPGQGAPAGAQAIEPITFTDEAIGLTETCDQIVPDFDASEYKAQSDHQTDTVYLVHCTLDFSGNLSSTAETNHSLNLIDDNDHHHMTMLMQASLEDDMKQAGLHPIGYDDYGTNHIDGWYAFTVWGKDGKTYEAYSTRAKVTVKNG